MTTKKPPKGDRTSAAIGLRALRGGAVVVAVDVAQGTPRVQLSTFLSTAVEGDRLAFEPYAVAAEMQRDAGGTASMQAATAVAEGRSRQDELAAIGLGEIVARLIDAGSQPRVAALLVNRAGWMTDLMAYSLAAPEHPPVADGLAVRDALRTALRRVSMNAVELDEKSLLERASEKFGISAADLNARLTFLGTEIGRPWRKEQKMACLAGWFALASL